MADWMNTMKKTTDPCTFETGIRGEEIFLRTKVKGTEAYSELSMSPDSARYIGEQLIAQANIVSPKKVTRGD